MIHFEKSLMLENLNIRDINPLICGEEICVSGHSFGPAHREYYLLHYVVTGKGEFYTDRGRHNVSSGQIFVVHPLENTLYVADDIYPWHYIWIGFEAHSPLPLLDTDIIVAPNCAHIFQSMVHCDLQVGKEWFICAKIYELFSTLSNNLYQPVERTSQYTRMAQNYIESNYVQELRVDSLASNLGLDRSYFSQIFKKHTGKSPQQYIVDFRLEKAAEFLTVQNLTPGEAARQVGYSDIFNFSRMFKKRFGVPPSKYKRLEGKKETTVTIET